MMRASETKADEAGKAPPHRRRSAPKLTIGSSDDTPFWAAFRGLVLGAPGVGKTHLLLTASKHYDGWPPKPGTVFDDILLIETDSLGLGCVREVGASVKHVLDLTAYTDAEIDSVKNEIPTLISNHVAEHPETRLVGLDTAGVFWSAVHARKADGPRGYIELAADARKFFWGLRKAECPVIFNCHIKDPAVLIQSEKGPVDPVAQHAAQQLAQGMAKETLRMDMPGRDVAKTLRHHASFTWHLEKRDMPGGKTDRVLRCKGKDVETKKRLSLAIEDIEEAHFGKLFAKISEACNVPMPGER